MDATRDIYEQLAVRTGQRFLDALQALPEFKTQAPIGLLRVTVTVVDGPQVGTVDVDPVNLGDLAEMAAQRAEGLRIKHATTTPAPVPAPSGARHLHAVGGA